MTRENMWGNKHFNIWFATWFKSGNYPKDDAKGKSGKMEGVMDTAMKLPTTLDD